MQLAICMQYAEAESVYMNSVLADSMMDIQLHLAPLRMQVSYSTVLDQMLSGHCVVPLSGHSASVVGNNSVYIISMFNSHTIHLAIL